MVGEGCGEASKMTILCASGEPDSSTVQHSLPPAVVYGKGCPRELSGMLGDKIAETDRLDLEQADRRDALAVPGGSRELRVLGKETQAHGYLKRSLS